MCTIDIGETGARCYKLSVIFVLLCEYGASDKYFGSTVFFSYPIHWFHELGLLARFFCKKIASSFLY
jgi:hypothetical protein